MWVTKYKKFPHLLPSTAKTLDIINIEATCPAETNLKSLGGNRKR